MDATALMNKTESYVSGLFKSGSSQLSYHNLDHTLNVVSAAIKICDHYQLEETDYLAVNIAAWFHDVGYLSGVTHGHEEQGAQSAIDFLNKENINKVLINKVKECILATKLPQHPVSLIEKITCDADLFHFGTEDFYEINKKVRKEAGERLNKKIPATEWLASTIKLLKQHGFQTDYCKTLLKKEKEKNIKRLEEKLGEKVREEKEGKNKKKDILNPIDLGLKDKEIKEFKAGRGIETMFRTTSTNHLKLSEMADSKANILLTINSLMVSILISVLFRHLDTNSQYIIPAGLFLLTALSTVVCAILVTLPHVTSGIFTKEDISNKDANLLFFGNFYKMKLNDYQWGINEMMKDPSFLYGTMSKDIYYLGVVLGRKYKLLRIAYYIFMIGFVCSILSFFIAGYLYRS